MTKDELIARLRSLGEQLNRDVSLMGTKEELALRVAELEEELDDTDDAAGQDTSVSPENVLTVHENEVVSAQPDTVTDTAEVFNGLLKTFYGHSSPFQRRRLTAGGTPRPSQR